MSNYTNRIDDVPSNKPHPVSVAIPSSPYLSSPESTVRSNAMSPQSSDPLKTEAPIYTELDLAEQHIPVEEPSIWFELQRDLRRSWKQFNVKRAAIDMFPFVKALPLYNKDTILRDVLVGVTVSVILIPQSLAHTVIAGLPASYGLYAAFIPTLLYSIFGGSRELSIGTFALTSLVLAQTIPQVAPNLTEIALNDPARADAIAVQAALGITLVSGIITLILAALRLGWVVTFFSKPALSAFLCGSAYTISTTQVAAMVQTKVNPADSFFQMWYRIFAALPSANVGGVLIGLLCIAALIIGDRIAKPPRVKFPIPFALILVILTTLISYFGDFKTAYGIKIVGKLDSAFPSPSIPSVPDFMEYFQASIVLSIINFIGTVSIGIQMASEAGYTLSGNQELFALSMCSILGSMFGAYTPAGSLSRSIVAQKMKPTSALWNLVVFALIALSIGALAPLLYHLPSATLAAIIIAAFESTFVKVFREPVVLWRSSKREALIWITTFFATLIGSTRWGIIIALLTSIGGMIQDVSRPHVCTLGRLKGSRLYRDVKRYPKAIVYPEVLVFRFDAALNFANQEYFYQEITKAIRAHMVRYGMVQPDPVLDCCDPFVGYEEMEEEGDEDDGHPAVGGGDVNNHRVGHTAPAAAAAPATVDAGVSSIELTEMRATVPVRVPMIAFEEKTNQVSSNSTSASASASASSSSASIPGSAPTVSRSLDRGRGRERGTEDSADGLSTDQQQKEQQRGGPGNRRGSTRSRSGSRTRTRTRTRSRSPARRRPRRMSRVREDERALLTKLMTEKWRRELHPEMKMAVVISAAGINSIDTSSIEMIKRLMSRKDILVLFAGLKFNVRKILYKSNAISNATTSIFPELHDAVTFGRMSVTTVNEKRLKQQQEEQQRQERDEDAEAEADEREHLQGQAQQGGQQVDNVVRIHIPAAERSTTQSHVNGTQAAATQGDRRNGFDTDSTAAAATGRENGHYHDDRDDMV